MKRFAFLLAICILLGVCGITFSACREKVILPSSSITLSMSLSRDGAVMQEIDFSLQEKRLDELGIKPELILEVRKNIIASLNALRNEFYLSFLLVYSLAPDPAYKIGDSLAVSDVFYDQEGSCVGFKILYKSLGAYQYFQGATLKTNVDEQTGDEQTNEQLLGKNNFQFVSRLTSEGAFPFAAAYTTSSGQIITVGERYQNIYRNSFNATLPNEIVAQLQTPSFVYDYALPFSNVRSNADTVIRAGGLYHNVWIKSMDNFKDARVKLTSTSVNAGLWYLTLLLIVIFVFSVVLVVILLLKKKKLAA